MKQKWRPPLALVIGGTLASVLCLPVLGFLALQQAGPSFGFDESLLAIGIGVVLATSLLGWLLWRLLLNPIYGVTDHARALRRGTSAPPPDRYGTPELRDLGRSVEEMGRALHIRAASLRAYADHVTHELKSPLTAASGAAELLTAPDLSAQDAQQLAGTISAATARMETLLSDLQRYARASQSSGPGASVLSDVAGHWRNVSIRRDGTVPLTAEDLRAVLEQLIQNAFASGAGNVWLDVGPEGLTVGDDGPGVPDGNRARVFDPFFTTRRDKGGTGMGLSIVRALLQARGGEIELLSEPIGAHFRIQFG